MTVRTTGRILIVATGVLLGIAATSASEKDQEAAKSAREVVPFASDESVSAPRLGANRDFIAYFGDGWDSDWDDGVVGGPLNFRGDDSSGRLWVNHEYVSNDPPTTTTASSGQHALLASWAAAIGLVSRSPGDSGEWSEAELREYIALQRKPVEGLWTRVGRSGDAGTHVRNPDATEPQWFSGERTLCFSAQHPGERVPSSFPVAEVLDGEKR